MAQFPNLSVFIGKKSGFRRYRIQNVKDGLQIQVYNISKDSVHHSCQFISIKFKKNLRRSQAQFREKLRKLRLRQNNNFLIKKTCIFLQHEAKKFSGLRYVAFHVLELRIIFYVESNRLCLGAFQIRDRVFAAIVENNVDDMNITHKYSTDEGCKVAIIVPTNPMPMLLSKKQWFLPVMKKTLYY